MPRSFRLTARGRLSVDIILNTRYYSVSQQRQDVGFEIVQPANGAANELDLEAVHIRPYATSGAQCMHGETEEHSYTMASSNLITCTKTSQLFADFANPREGGQLAPKT
jgi:hypothetical protein